MKKTENQLGKSSGSYNKYKYEISRNSEGNMIIDNFSSSNENSASLRQSKKF